MRVFLWLWSALWTLGVPLVLAYLWRRARKDPVYGQHLGERFGIYPKALPGAVWVHGVSLGETRSAVPLIRALLGQGEKVVTTHFTPAGRREAERVFAPEIAAGQLCAVWVPLETGWAYAGFFRAFRPRYGLVMEIEVWPRMTFAARRANVALFMCNAQYPSRSILRDSKGLRLRQAVMRGFAGALVKSQLQADRFAAIGVQNIAVTGELRFDQPIPPALVAQGIAARAWLGAQDRAVIAIASAIEGEDAIYLQAIAALRADHTARGLPAPLFLYIPRRPERFDEVFHTVRQAGLQVVRRSALWPQRLDSTAWNVPPAGFDVLLGDSLGEMYFYLAMADRVIVGGGFNPKGAHNISEPLALLKPVLTGPHTFTIEYPFAEAEAAGVALSVPDAAALSDALIFGFNPSRAQIEAFLAAHAGATEKTMAALPKLLAARV
jgi:3-deoxy-D-manno-octulosonic-acid transferase